MHADGPGLDPGSSFRGATRVVVRRMRSHAAHCIGVTGPENRIARESRWRNDACGIAEHA